MATLCNLAIAHLRATGDPTIAAVRRAMSYDALTAPLGIQLGLHQYQRAPTLKSPWPRSRTGIPAGHPGTCDQSTSSGPGKTIVMLVSDETNGPRRSKQ